MHDDDDDDNNDGTVIQAREISTCLKKIPLEIIFQSVKVASEAVDCNTHADTHTLAPARAYTHTLHFSKW